MYLFTDIVFYMWNTYFV